MSISATSRRITGVLALLVLTALLPLTAASAQDERTVVDLDLVADDVSDPVETSILYSRQTFGSAEQALVATAFDGADALASGSLQSGVGEAAATDTEGTAVTGRPLLFVDPTAGPEQALFDELSRLGVTSIILLGGESAIPPAVADAFEEAGFADVQRMGGTTRVATASLVAEYVLANSDTTTAYLSRAFGTAEDTDTAYADSSALGGWAASTGNPILLTATESLSLETSLLLQQGDIERVEIVGGPEAVSDDVEQTLVDMGLEVNRTEGDTRDQTAVAIADARGAADAGDAPRVIVTEGFAHSGLADAPILLTNGDDLSPATATYLEGAAFAIADSGLVGICGTDLSATLCTDVATALDATVTTVTLDTDPTDPGTADQVGDLAVTPQEETTTQVAIDEDRTGAADDAVTFTTTDLDPETNYRVTLVVADNITIDGDDATFADADDSTPDTEEDDGLGNGQADAGASEEIALITAVNGEALETPAKTTPATDDDPAEPTAHQPDEDGTLTVTVDGVEDSNGGTVYAVVYVNGGESTFLEVDEDGAPTEAYGVSGAFTLDPVVGDLDVADHDPVTVNVDSVTGTDAEGDERTYTVTGLDDDTAYRITLVPGDNITFTEGDDEATFVEAVGEDEEPNGLADSAGAESVATIVEVNGEAVTEEEQGRTVPAGDDDPSDPSGIFPVDGVITFTIDGVDSAILPTPNPGGTIRPVVYVNGGESTFLEIDEDGAPTEVYGVGGAFTTSPFPG
jgi:hypothetical protein